MKKQWNKGRECLKPSPNEEVCTYLTLIMSWSLCSQVQATFLGIPRCKQTVLSLLGHYTPNWEGKKKETSSQTGKSKIERQKLDAQWTVVNVLAICSWNNRREELKLITFDVNNHNLANLVIRPMFQSSQWMHSCRHDIVEGRLPHQKIRDAGLKI